MLPAYNYIFKIWKVYNSKLLSSEKVFLLQPISVLFLNEYIELRESHELPQKCIRIGRWYTVGWLTKIRPIIWRLKNLKLYHKGKSKKRAEKNHSQEAEIKFCSFVFQIQIASRFWCLKPIFRKKCDQLLIRYCF